MRFFLMAFFLFLSLTNVYAGLPGNTYPLGEKFILVDPKVYAWGAYNSDGRLIRSGVASPGKGWCPDIKRSCRTQPGSYRIYYLGDKGCYSTRFPVPHGGAPMPYCMYFNGNQALHGSHQVGRANLSHGCVRLTVRDAAWLRFNFAQEGTLVIIRPY